MNEQLINILRTGRMNRGLKQSEVANLVGVKGGTISNYENGVSEPDIETFCELCKIYAIDPASALNSAYGLNDNDDLVLYPHEQMLVNKYRVLDREGMEFVNMVLEREYARCVNAASNEQDTNVPYVTPEEIEMCKKLAEEDMKKRNEFNDKEIG